MVLETLVGLGIDYDDLAMSILTTIEESIMERMDDVNKNWDGDVDALRAAVVAEMISDMEAKGTRVGRWEASALSKCYYQMYDESLPDVP